MAARGQTKPEDRVREQIRRWRDELINLSRTNRLLYFRHTKASTIEVHSPEMATVVDTLEQGGRWAFYEAPPDDLDAPPRPARPEELVTNKADAKSLTAALRNLDRRADQEFMDKGLWILYLAAGVLEWVDDDGEKAESPIVLFPVTLHRETPREPFRLRRTEDDPVVNPALAVKLETNYGITLPTFDPEGDLDLDALCQEVAQAVKSQPGGWTVNPRLILAPFSFFKEAMYRDLLDNEELVVAHELVSALAEEADPDVGGDGFEPVPDDQLDEKAPAEELVSIRDADASQRQAIAAAMAGTSFVMDGPPGSGKSQTIANIIAELIHDGKKVLFVSEKAAALEVVKDRLDDAGLGQYVLELHSHKATRKEVARALGHALRNQPRAGAPVEDADLRMLVRRRRELSAYAVAINETRPGLSRSLHSVLGRIAELDGAEAAQAPLPKVIHVDLEADAFARLCELGADLSRAWGPVTRGEDFHWRDLADPSDAVGRSAEIKVLLDQMPLTLERVRDLANAVEEEVGHRARPSIAGATLLAELVAHLAVRPANLPGEWLTTSDLPERQQRAAALGQVADGHAGLVAALEAQVPTWRQLDPEAGGLLDQAEVTLGSVGVPITLAQTATSRSVASVAEFLKASAADIDRHRQTGETLAAELGLADPDPPLSRALEIGELALLAGAAHRPDPRWLDPVVSQAVHEAASVLSRLVEDYRHRREALTEVFTDDVLELDLEGLTQRFRHVHKGAAKLKGVYRADKRTLAGVTRAGKVTKKALERVDEALAWQKLTADLDKAEARHGSVLGSDYYSRDNTDFAVLTDAIEVADRALRLAGAHCDPARLGSHLGTGGGLDPKLFLAAQEMVQSLHAWPVEARQSLGEVSDDLVHRPMSQLSAACAATVGPAETIAGLLGEIAAGAGQPIPLGEVRHIVADRAALARLEDDLALSEHADRDLFGEHYAGWETDFARLRAALEWAIACQQITGGPVRTRVATRMLGTVMSPDDLTEALASWSKVRDQLGELFLEDQRLELTADLESSYEAGFDLMAELAGHLADITEWKAHLDAASALREAGLDSVIAFSIDRHIRAEGVAPCVERAILAAWTEAVLATDKRLRYVRATDRDEFVQQFRELDRQVVDVAARRVIGACNERRPKTLVGAASIIAREAEKKRRHMPVRTLLSQTATVAQALKPCFMMSPLSVSQFLRPETRFDVVIFDEASQVRPSDSINCIYRGDQLIVAGDQKQLPPTSFFMAAGIDEGDDYVEGQLEEFESILDHCKATPGIPSLPLRWHYRSQHEDLIAFSNYSFYDGKLITFPATLQRGPDVGVELFKVDGVYRRGGSRDNPIEAGKVVERVLFHARNHPHLTLGVVAFSEAQASLIEALVDAARSTAPDLDEFFSGDRLSGFFVKNLENVQGDERDIIIFSVGYGPDEVGKFTLNFGPLNRPGGERRLNVAITRARRRVELVSSIGAEDFTAEVKADGVRHLRRYLDFAARGMPALAMDLEDGEGDAESPFEEEVARVLRSWGHDVALQVGTADYRIDLAVRDPAKPGRFVLGIECDGAMYHSSKVARDRDRLRQEVLERLGWRLYRIWGTAWYRDRPEQMDWLRAAVDAAIADGPVEVPSHRRPVTEIVLEEPDLDGAPEWALPYKPAQLIRSFGRIEMHEPSARPEMKKLIAKVVEVEGPVHVETVLTRVREAWGVGRAGHRIRTNFDTAVFEMAATGRIEDNDGFLSLLGPADAVEVRCFTEDAPESRRSIQEVPPSELRAGLVHLVEDAQAITWDDLTANVARIFGWARRGPDITQALDFAIEELLDDGLLVRDNEHLQRGES